MTETGPPPEVEFLRQPPPLTRAVAMLLVTRYRLRLCDPRDSRLGELASDYALAAAAWTGPRSALVAFYDPPADPDAQVADLHRRIGAALRWGDSRLRIQPAQRCDILLVPMAPIRAQLPPPAHPAVSVGVLWVDPGSAEVGALLPPPPNLTGAAEIRAAARALLRGAEAPTLAAVDLAEREAVHGGYVAPVRQALLSTPRLTYAMVATFVVWFLVENVLIQRYGNDGYLAAGGIAVGFGGDDWWRYLSTAFLHLPGGFGFWPETGPLSYISLHLIINSYSAIVLGRIIEPMYGRLTLLGTFLATAFVSSGVSAGAASLNLPDSSPLFLGASGGLMGLLGLLFTIGRVQGRNVPAGLARALRQGVLFSLVLTVILGFTVNGINNYAHLGGFVSGAVIGLVFPPVRAVGGKDLAMWQRVALIAVMVVSAVALLFAIANIGMFLASNPVPISTGGR